MYVFNGSATIIRYNDGSGLTIWTDACASGYGIYAGYDWQAGRFNSNATLINVDVSCHEHWRNVIKPVLCANNDNVNFWELLAVYQAVSRYAESARNSHMIIRSDNTQVIAMVNGSASINESCLELLREIFWLSAIFNVYITAKHISGVQNVVADRLSRLELDVDYSELHDLLCCSIEPARGIG